ncbi:unnamed protein product [Didymodactylos carnosus]|uniref:F-box domain-containing protein n=2 Tax=Didymodactylos carnosus TaxID=1234261 RepID=A0A815GZC7_9BILA|nr:unnamed protein product [Didymodactylos carnosus]CAF4209777.1 unnamed protein product [Didymodactylos carnosus]
MVSVFEQLPDEILLTCYRYLRPYDVLYSFHSLNSRLNQTISVYQCNIDLLTCNYFEFINYIDVLFPIIGIHVHSLCLSQQYTHCQIKLFDGKIIKKYNDLHQLFPNLKSLKLVHCDSDVTLFMLKKIEYLSIIYIEYKSNLIDQQYLFENLLSNRNKLLSKITILIPNGFELVSNYNQCLNVKDLTIKIKNLKDLFLIFEIFRNLKSLHVIIVCRGRWGCWQCGSDQSAPLQSKELSSLNKLSHLTDFQLQMSDPLFTFTEFRTLFECISAKLEKLSLYLNTENAAYIDGNQWKDLFSSVITILTTFKFYIRSILGFYSVNVDKVMKSFEWIHPKDKHCYIARDHLGVNYLYFYTIPFGFKTFELIDSQSTLTNFENGYSNVEQLILNSQVNDEFSYLKQFRNIEKLTYIGEEHATSTCPKDMNFDSWIVPIKLIKLSHLSIDSIGLSTFCRLIKIAPYLLSLNIHNYEQFQRKILLYKPEMTLRRIEHLTVQFESCKSEQNDIIRLASIFPNVKYLQLKMIKCPRTFSIEIVRQSLFSFKNLRFIQLQIDGNSLKMIVRDPSKWLSENTILKYLNKQFYASCNQWNLQIWI